MGIVSSLENAAEKAGEMIGIKKEDKMENAAPAVEGEAGGTINTPVAPVADSQVAPPPSESPSQTYTVQHGDTLSKISERFYGNAHNYMKIYEANRDKLSNPDQINVGEELTIPSA